MKQTRFLRQSLLAAPRTTTATFASSKQNNSAKEIKNGTEARTLLMKGNFHRVTFIIWYDNHVIYDMLLGPNKEAGLDFNIHLHPALNI